MSYFSKVFAIVFLSDIIIPIRALIDNKIRNIEVGVFDGLQNLQFL